MTFTGMRQHFGVLEQAGLVGSEKVGRLQTCRLGLLNTRSGSTNVPAFASKVGLNGASG